MNVEFARSRGQRTLSTAQHIVAEDDFWMVANCLRQHACVVFALSCVYSVDWSPEVDIAVRLLSIARYGHPVDQGELIWESILTG